VKPKIYNPDEIEPRRGGGVIEAALSRLPADTTAGAREAIAASLAAILDAAELEESRKSLKICRN
jgi:hypothetical protein